MKFVYKELSNMIIYVGEMSYEELISDILIFI